MEFKYISQIEHIIKYVFHNKDLLVQAFTHSSYANAVNVEDNERMEFFGDAILEYVVSEQLYDLYPSFDAGDLSKVRAEIVSADGLRPVISKMKLLRYLLLGNGAGTVKNLSKKIEANLYEALLCAIYIDGGMKSAKDFVNMTLGDVIRSIGKPSQKDYKTRLQEYCQANKKVVKYLVVDKSGPDNKPTFTCQLLVDEVVVSQGVGSSKKLAEQNCAQKIVEQWRID